MSSGLSIKTKRPASISAIPSSAAARISASAASRACAYLWTASARNSASLAARP